MMSHMTGGGYGWVMMGTSALVIVVLVLAVGALVKYLFFD
jgi:ABC-type Co2+ transport system permease subunit